MGEQATRKDICPLVNNPLRECFCFETNSRNAEMALDFCGANYRECRIYKKYRMQSGVPHHGNVGNQL